MAIKIGNHHGREETGTATMVAIKKATESNQLRLHTLELAVAHLTNICIGLTDEVRSLKSILLESNRIRKDPKETVTEMKLPYYSNSSSLSSESKDDGTGAKKVKRQPWKKDTKIIPAIKVQGRKPQGPIKAASKTSQKGSTESTKPAKLRPAMAAMRAKASVQVNDAKSVVPLKVKEGGRTSSKGITVKLPPQMAEAPTIRSLIYGSRSVSVVMSRGAHAQATVKKRA
ncbi:hypothetical protein V2J09_019019 [Rumex salicifolius]